MTLYQNYFVETLLLLPIAFDKFLINCWVLQARVSDFILQGNIHKFSINTRGRPLDLTSFL